MFIRAMILVTAALASGAIAAGCGGGDSSASESGSSTAIAASAITRTQFVEQANSICVRGKARLFKQLAAYQRQHADESKSEVAAVAARTILRPSVQDQIQSIVSLGAPRGDVEEIEAFLVALSKGIDEVVARQSSSFALTRQLLRPAGNQARKYGIEQCAYGY